MRLLPGSVRGKFTVVSLALVTGIVLLSGGVLEAMLRRALERRLESELNRHVDAIMAVLARQDLPRPTRHALAEQAARAAGLRFTLIDATGNVLADSHVEDARLAALEDHARRPEVVLARRFETGVVKRVSQTLGEELLYLARPLPDAGAENAVPSAAAMSVVRVAMPVAAGEAVLRNVRLALLVTGLVALGLGVLMSLWSAHLVTRSLRELVVKVRALAEHRTRARIRLGSDDELELLAGSVNRLAGEVDDTLSKLEAERDRFRAVVEGIDDGVVAIDRTGRILLMNTAARRLLGDGRDSSDDPHAVGQSHRVAPHDEPLNNEQPPHLEALLPALRVRDLLARPAGEPAVELEVQGGRRVQVHASPSAVSDGAVLVLEDVTSVRRLENMRRDFVANVSHELRTPVSVIRASAEALIDGGLEDPARAARFAGAVHRNAERLSRLISDLLDLARIESGQHALTMRPLRVRAAVTDIVTRLQPLIDGRRHSLAIEVADDLAVLADDGGFEQVLANLVDNAAKYTPEGGQLMVRAHAHADVIRIHVEDNGPGIPPEHRDRVFERFYRVDTGRSREMGGTGLGLSIVKHLVAIMGGDVRVEAADSGGSRFVVVLPRG